MNGYAIVLTPDDNDTFLVTSPDIPEVTSFGNSETDAMLHANDAVIAALAARIAHGRDVPEPSGSPGSRSIILSSNVAFKIALYRALKIANINRAELARRLGWHREQVDRLFRLEHESKTSQLDAAATVLARDGRASIWELVPGRPYASEWKTAASRTGFERSN